MSRVGKSASSEQVLTGWGRTSPSRATVIEVVTQEQVQNAIQSLPSRGVLARGMGRSYGDAGQNSGGIVFNLNHFSKIVLNPAESSVSAGAGATLEQIMCEIVPQGYFVPVSPGTRQVSLGGAIAADIHGKNHHIDGSFGNHVLEISIIDGLGNLRQLTPHKDTEMFWATIGGMGLTGVIVEAKFKVLPIQSAFMSVDTVRTNDLDDTMERMIREDSNYKYSVAWIDTVHPSGRGVITRGDHAGIELIPENKRDQAHIFQARALTSAPAIFPSGLLNKITVRAFNEAWYRKSPKTRTTKLQSIGSFFHPLDGVSDWNRVYGKAGFVQYQFSVPDSSSHVIALTLEKLRNIGALSFLTVLKRFGLANPAPLSFPQPGWTLALDLPAGVPNLSQTLDELDSEVLHAQGRLYLAKDSRMSPRMFRDCYPEFEKWNETRKVMDPEKVFISDLARRLVI